MGRGQGTSQLDHTQIKPPSNIRPTVENRYVTGLVEYLFINHISVQIPE